MVLNITKKQRVMIVEALQEGIEFNQDKIRGLMTGGLPPNDKKEKKMRLKKIIRYGKFIQQLTMFGI